MDDQKYYLVKSNILPEIMVQVAEAKRLLETGTVSSVREATNLVGISRSSFYKYKDGISPFHENVKGYAITVLFQVKGRVGLLAEMLAVIAAYRARILTIHQSIPINDITTITISIDISSDTRDVSSMIKEIESIQGVQKTTITSNN